MAEPHSKRDVRRFAAFLDELKGDLEADGGDCMVCLSAAMGLMKQEKPTDFLPPINPTRQGRLAIILCMHGESEKFPGMLEMLLDPETGVITSYVARPDSLKSIMFRYTVAKEARGLYKSMGDYDPYNADCYGVLEKLKARFPGDITVDLGFMDCRPFIEEKVVEAVNNGASKVICVHTMVTVSDHTNEIEERVDSLELKGKGIEVCFTEPFWNDEKFIKHACNRVLEVIGDEEKSKVGVACLLYGIPEVDISPGKTYYTSWMETAQRYAQAYLKKLEEYGIKNATTGYLRFNKPDISDCAKTLAEKGARLIVFDWYHCARCLHADVEMPRDLEKVKPDLPEGIRLAMAGPGKDRPELIDVLFSQIEKTKKKFGK